MGGVRRRRGNADVLLAVALGGAVGGTARHALTLLVPHDGTGFPWATFTENVAGCLAIGALMVVITEMVTPHRLLRPFLGVGVLGGFTTFSAYAVDALSLVEGGAPLTALAYLAATLLAALAAVRAGAVLARAAARHRRTRSDREARGSN
ncbi:MULTISPECIES: CrcB family protein [unclassified Nocardiopsis]|uniref:fluoride efflux transporter FluC n=1 Tax=unclassified Nocardiopsis TaxID=2649073 RepID=UPI0013589481|nr:MULTISPECIES: CrcB family protein [unclassified Nocardiopsis]